MACLLVLTRLPHLHSPSPAPEDTEVFLRRNIAALRRALLPQAVLAVILSLVYRSGSAEPQGGGRQLQHDEHFSRYAATYCPGVWAVIAFACVTVAAASRVHSLMTLPRRPSQTPRAKRPWTRKCRLWSRVLMCTVLTSWPATLNVFVKCSPYVPHLLLNALPYLPAVGAALHVLVQPTLLRRIAARSNVGAYKLQVLQGVSSWGLPLATIVYLSPSCYGAWWTFMPACTEERTWTCEYRRGVQGWLSYCTSNHVFDVTGSGEDDCSFLNRTHCHLMATTSAEEICHERWSKVTSCTATSIDIISFFIFEKFLVACLLTPSLLLASSFAQSSISRRAGVGILREDYGPEGGIRTFLAVRIRGVDRRILSLSDKFTPPQVLQRLSVWSDLAFSWGLLYPPIAIAGLGHLWIETWCYDKAVKNFQYLEQQPEVFQIPRFTMLTWFMAANVVGALHVASVVREEPDSRDVVAALTMMVLSWLVGLWRGSSHEVKKVEPVRDEETCATIELATAQPVQDEEICTTIELARLESVRDEETLVAISLGTC
eukprot:TRINITY_DN19262_c0_g1_i4.p1 TRINITY_DN19262_c0_g1~~TRINITY_DN19262_c0_g1_i4.p1  ORF type:complete len:544 (+),score=46.87 TRINITY_DN19262_c0_g1_i4:469-2100(+)